MSPAQVSEAIKEKHIDMINTLLIDK